LQAVAFTGFPKLPNPAFGVDSSPGVFQKLGTPADGVSPGFGPFASKINPVPAVNSIFPVINNPLFPAPPASKTPADGVAGPTKSVQNIPGLSAANKAFPGLPVKFTIPAYTPLPNFPSVLPKGITIKAPLKDIPLIPPKVVFPVFPGFP
jgi:hypothetical protein